MPILTFDLGIDMEGAAKRKRAPSGCRPEKRRNPMMVRVAVSGQQTNDGYEYLGGGGVKKEALPHGEDLG